MRARYKVALSALVGVIVAASIIALFSNANFMVLNTQGAVADQQRDLIVFTVLLSLVVVVPVFILLFGIAWRFRASNTKARYRPDWDGNPLLEAVWWGIPFAIIMVLSTVIWVTSNQLDPYRPLVSDKKPVNVQVVALQWKWLFIYPDQKIATVNQLRIPVGTPINFTITADAPMNSFWIPSLGGQVYAMSGMSTKLHLIANNEGEYYGSSANISGEGFAGMKFMTTATDERAFNAWVSTVKAQSEPLDTVRYGKLAKPSQNTPKASYVLDDKNLYNTIVMKYMDGHSMTEGHHHEAGASH